MWENHYLESYEKVIRPFFYDLSIFNTYGPIQSMDFVISKFLNLALRGDDITIYGDGSQTRTFCYVDDNINACIKIFEENYCLNDVINIGGAKEFKIIEVAKTIIKISGSSSKIHFFTSTP